MNARHALLTLTTVAALLTIVTGGLPASAADPGEYTLFAGSVSNDSRVPASGGRGALMRGVTRSAATQFSDTLRDPYASNQSAPASHQLVMDANVYTFTADPTSAPQGGEVTVQSVDPCPGANVTFVLRDAQGADHGGLSGALGTDPGGSWSGTSNLALDAGSGAGEYELVALCGNNATLLFEYAGIPFTVTPSTFTADPTSAPQGGEVTVQSVDPCPGANVTFVLRDAQGADHGGLSGALGTDPGGSWSGTSNLALDAGSGAGEYELVALCGNNATLLFEYAGIPFTVTPSTFTADPTSAPQGGEVTVQSVDPCPGANVTFVLRDAQGADHGGLSGALGTDPGGSWSGTSNLALDAGSGAGEYELVALCGNNATLLFEYAGIPFTVTPSTFTADPTSAPQGGEVTVQSVDPCPGANVTFVLRDAQGADHGGLSGALGTDPGGSWSGTSNLALDAGSGAGEYELVALCGNNATLLFEYAGIPFTVTGSTPPAVTGIPDRAPNAAGWYTAPVTIDWQATDDSGSATDPPDTVASTEGADVVYTSAESCDPSGNCATGSLTLSIDTVAPVVTVPADSLVDAIGSGGATVSYSASASDLVDPTPSLSCLPTSGSVFPIGTTVVTCTATDDAGNSANKTFNVGVRGAAAQIVALIDKTLAFLDLPSLRPGLRARLETVASALAANHPQAACLALGLYRTAVNLAPARALTAPEKAELIADANRIRAVIGCA